MGATNLQNGCLGFLISVMTALDIDFAFGFDFEIFDTPFTIFSTNFYFYKDLSIFLTGLDTERTILTFLSHLRNIEESISLMKLLSVNFLVLVLGKSFILDLVCKLCFVDFVFFEAKRE